MNFYKNHGINILSGTQETFEALSHFLYNMEVTLKEYKNNEQLIEYLISKNVTIANKEQALKNIEKYSYYSIVNGYKSVFIINRMLLLKKYLLYMSLIKI